MSQVRKSLAEFLGTFTLVFAGTGAIVVNKLSNGAVTHPGIALTFGLVVTAMIYAFGGISGAHLNPAVTLGLCAARQFPVRQVPLYMASQICGALAASALMLALFGNTAFLGATLPSGSALQSFMLEIVLTAILMLTILCVCSGPAEARALAGIAIGGVIGLEAMFAGPICGASMNPARSLAPALMSGHLDALWVYLAGPALGSIVAVALFAVLNR